MFDGFMAGSPIRRVFISSIPVAMLLASASVAADDDLHVEINYTALGSNCPSRQEFVANVGRGLMLSASKTARGTRKFAVILEDARGTLEVWGENGPRSHEVRGASCAEVGRAIALATALSLNPKSTAEEPGPSSFPVPPSSSAAELPRAPSSRANTTAWSAGMGLVSLVGPTQQPALGGGVFLDLPYDHGRIIAPRVRLASVCTTNVVPSPDAAGILWQWYLARVELCGLHFGAASYGVRLCLALDAGAIVSRATGLRRPSPDVRLWLAPELGPRVFWEASGFLLEFGVGASAPLRSYEYYYIDDTTKPYVTTTVYRIVPVGATFFLGVAFR